MKAVLPRVFGWRRRVALCVLALAPVALACAVRWRAEVMRERESWKPRDLKTGLSRASYVSFSVDGQRLVAAGTDNRRKWPDRQQAQVWDLGSGQRVASSTISWVPERTVGLALSPDNRLLAGSSGSSTWIWDAHDGHLVRALKKVKSVVFAPDGRSFYEINDQRNASWLSHEPDVRRLDARTLQVLEAHDVQPPPGLSFLPPPVRRWASPSTSCHLAPRGRALSLALWGTSAREPVGMPRGFLLVDLRSGRRHVLPVPNEGRAAFDVFSAREDVLALVMLIERGGAWSTSVRLWDVAGGRLRSKWEVRGDWQPLFFSPDGAYLMMWSWPNSAHGQFRPTAFDARDGRKLFSPPVDTVMDLVRPSPDGALIAAPGTNLSANLVLLFDARTGKLVRHLPTRHAQLLDIDWAPDSSNLVAAWSDGVVNLWRVR